MMVSAAILAGGRSRRFLGRDKSALVVDGRTILEHQVAELSRMTGDIVLVGSQRSCDGLRAVPDRVPGCGPLGGLHTAFAETRGDALVVVACDMPHVTAPLLKYLLALTAEADIVVPRTRCGLHPVCAAYARSCAAVVAEHLAEKRLAMMALFDVLRVRIVHEAELRAFGDGDRLLANVNTPEELALLEGLPCSG